MKDYDIEIYPNYSLFSFSDPKTKELQVFDMFGRDSKLSKSDRKVLKKILKSDTIITYNGINYDIPLTEYALSGATCHQLYLASKEIIDKRRPYYMSYRKFGIQPMEIDHIDLQEPSPAVMVSLKLYGTRLGSKRLWDLPFDPMKDLVKKEAKVLRDYCENDLIVTNDLYNGIKKRIDLRVSMSDQYGIDLRSKSDAQIAEAVITSELEKVGVTAMKPSLSSDAKIKYVPPKYIKFKTPQLQKVLDLVETIDFGLDKGGSVKLPKALTAEKIVIGKTTYTMGIGGLHSTEKSLVVESDEHNVMCNADMASYYPFIILKNKIFPEHLGEKFLTIYQKIVDTRIQAKHEGNKLVADSLKITINGSFGKFGSRYSKLYSPDLMLFVTLTGQLTLLMVIEKLERKGIPVVSSNTDGIEYLCPRNKRKKAIKIMDKLDKKTGYTMEHGTYHGLYARDVNNYVAKYDGYVKAKGVYADPNSEENFLKKSPQSPICFEAVRKYLLDGTPLKKTIKKSKDVLQFLSARTVNGGAMLGEPIYGEPQQAVKKDGTLWFTPSGKPKMVTPVIDWRDGSEYLGKVARWYYSKNGSVIRYKSNGNKVPLAEGVTPMMDVTDKLPEDLDYDWYYKYAQRMLDDLGV